MPDLIHIVPNTSNVLISNLSTRTLLQKNATTSMTLRHGREYRQIVLIEVGGLCRLWLPPSTPLCTVLSRKGVKSTLSFLLLYSS